VVAGAKSIAPAGELSILIHQMMDVSSMEGDSDLAPAFHDRNGGAP